ncbi:MAG: hypothetical protein QG620_29 [Patescibacteria group bacterium]|nr:hypothetical protein [Patescibacteria group bacterium]
MPINALLIKEAKLSVDSKVAMMAGLLDPEPISRPVFIPSYNPNPESEDMGRPVTAAEALQAEKIMNLGECCKGGKTCSCGLEQKTFFELLLAKVANERGLGVPLNVVFKEIEERYGRSSVASIKLTLAAGQEWPAPPSC